MVKAYNLKVLFSQLSETIDFALDGSVDIEDLFGLKLRDTLNETDNPSISKVDQDYILSIISNAKDKLNKLEFLVKSSYNEE